VLRIIRKGINGYRASDLLHPLKYCPGVFPGHLGRHWIHVADSKRKITRAGQIARGLIHTGLKPIYPNNISCERNIRMKSLTEIHVFGSLRKSLEDRNNNPLRIDLQSSTPIIEILKNAKIRPQEVQLTMVNYRATSKDAAVQPGDRLSLFPKEYPIFADWKDLRFK